MATEQREELVIVECEHCGKVAKFEPRGATQLKLQLIGQKHRLSWVSRTGSATVPRVVDDGGIVDIVT